MLTPRRNTSVSAPASAALLRAEAERAGKVRIIGGSLRNSRLPVLERGGLRPTPDRVRETLFNWLAPALEGARCLDLYAGSGALGIEALSRGAAWVELVESERDLAENLREQLTRLHVADRAQVRTLACEAFLREAPTQPFEVVFLDPPYAAQAWSAALAALIANGWLKRGALVYIEWPHPQRPQLPEALTWWRESRAGLVGYGLARAANVANGFA
ncbi:MAG: 16S rRNA (guanine(966)-N(2))-methyltransferase RsmD [Lysobacterales bacterium]